METKILLVGSGGYGAVYARQLYGGAHARENVRVAGVVDPYAAKGPLYEAICAAGTPIYNTVQEFYAQDRADLAVIATPIPLHREQASACLRAGSHVLLEKPICAEMEQAKAIAAARDASGKQLAIGFQWCWDGAMQRLRELARSGKLGAPVCLRALVIWPRDFAYYGRGSGWAGKEYDAKGNPIFDSVASNATAHYLFNMFWVTGRAPVACSAQTYRANEIETYDTAFFRYALQGGGEALFIATHAAENERTVNPRFVYEFERGRAVFGEEDNHIRVFAEGETIDLGESSRDNCLKLWQMVDVARGEESIPCTAEEAMMHLQAIEMARAAQPHARCFAHIEKDEKRAWAPGLYDAAMRCYASFQLPQEAGLAL